MISLTAAVDTAMTDVMAATGAAQAQESLNVLELAMKGGWIMIVLAVLSLIGIYIFFERFVVLRKAGGKNPSLLARINNTAGLEIAALEKGLPVLSTISAVAPMLGFLGTVTGMVQAFWNMSQAGDSIEVSALSGGIYEAMVTTVAGLIVGIIAIFAYNYLVVKVDKVQNAMEADIISFLEIVTETKEADSVLPDCDNDDETV